MDLFQSYAARSTLRDGPQPAIAVADCTAGHTLADKNPDCRDKGKGDRIMMNDGYGGMMGAGGIWMWLIGILVLLAIAALVKYLMK